MNAPRFQLVATLTEERAPLARALAQAGATSFRLNASHLSPEALRRTAELIRSEVPRIPIVVDLQGAKMRLGVFTERAIAQGETVRFSLEPSLDGAIALPHPEFFAATRVGETLSCDDDRLRFRVSSISERELEAKSLSSGVVRGRKGVNLLEHPVELSDLTLVDQERLAAVAEREELTFAFSFMTDGREADWLRRRAPRARIVGKVEREEAILALGSIDERVDELWLCRGDLGAQLGMARLAEVVSSISPRAMRRPTLMAGQVLEHLTEHSAPTRSEVCHLFDLMARGYAGIVLSDETALGGDPVRAVESASSLISEFAALRR